MVLKYMIMVQYVFLKPSEPMFEFKKCRGNGFEWDVQVCVMPSNATVSS